MDIGKYKQAMSYLLNSNATLKTFVINPDAKLIDNDPKPQIESLNLAGGGSVERQEFGNGGRPAIGIAYERPDVLKIAEKVLKKSIEVKDGFNILNWDEKATHPELIKEFKKNKIKLTNREFLNKIISNISKKNNWIDPTQYRREIVVDSFMKHLNTVGEFDGEEKLAKELKPFLGTEATKDKPSKLYETINRDFRDWRAGKFEVSTVDRDLLDKNALKEIKNWMPRTTNIRSVQRKEQLEFLNNLNDKNISLNNVKNKFVKKFSNLENPLQTFNQRVAQLNVLKLEGKLPSNKDATQFKTYKNIQTGERSPWLKSGLTDIYAGNYSKLIQTADILEANGKTKEAKRLYDAAEKFFSPNDGIFRKEGGQAEHPFSRKYGGTADQQLKVNSLIEGDLNTFKKINFDDPVNQSIEKYNVSTEDKVKKSLQKEIELRKQFMNYVTGSKEFGGIVDPVEFEFTPNEVKVKTNVTPIDKIKNFDVDVFKQRGEAYGKAVSDIGENLGLLTKEGYLKNRKISLDKIEEILNKINVPQKSSSLNVDVVPGLGALTGTQAASKIGKLALGISKATGAPFNAALGAILNSPEMREKGLGRLDSLLFGAGKGATQDLANFLTYVARTPEALYKTFKEDPNTQKVRYEQFLENLGEEKYKFANELADWYSNRISTKEYIDNLAQLEYEKELQKVMPAPSISETEVFDTDQYLNEELFKKKYREKLFKQFPEFKDEYNYVNKEPAITQKGVLNFNVEDLTQPQELAKGGRVGYADGGGPKFTRRGALGLLGALAATPLVKSLMKGEKFLEESKVAKVAKRIPKTKGMPEWFPSLVARIEKEGKYVGKDTGLVDNLKIKELKIPSKTGKGGDEIYTMIEHPNGDITIEANVSGGAFDGPFELHYSPPKTDMNVETGQPITYPGEFHVLENRPISTARSHHDADFELDYQLVSPEEAISDIEKVERVATGRRIHPKRVEERTAARKYIEENPYEDIINRYGEANPKDWFEE